jgi:3-oxoacyl-[acyl-carrier protein] reductase
MDLGLQGKRALVTGASRGIGRATVETLAAEGCSLAICARGEEDLLAFAKDLTGRGIHVFARAVDVGQDGALAEFVDAAAADLGGLDIVVSNVSAGSVKGPGQWQTSLDTDLLPLVRAIETALPHFEAAGGGSVVAISSTSGFDSAPPSAPNSYAAFKAAVIAHASGMAHKLAPLGVRVNTVSPGPVFFEDGPWDNIKKNRTALYESVLANIPLGRMGTAEEIASAVAFLASPVSGYCTGVNLVADGGMVSRVQF